MSGPILLVLRLALVIALYAFLAWALITLWRDLKRQGEMLVHQQAPPITLTRNGHRELEPLRFTTSIVTIGRDPTCDVLLEDKTVSASHAWLSYHHGQWWVEDLQSRNGTFLNNEVVSTQLVLTTDDRLRFGQVEFSIAIG
jgi:hypothetical protein